MSSVRRKPRGRTHSYFSGSPFNTFNTFFHRWEKANCCCWHSNSMMAEQGHCKTSKKMWLHLRWEIHSYKCWFQPHTESVQLFQRLETETVYMVSKTIKMLGLLKLNLLIKLQIMELTHLQITVWQYSTSKSQYSLLRPFSEQASLANSSTNTKSWNCTEKFQVQLTETTLTMYNMLNRFSRAVS